MDKVIISIGDFLKNAGIVGLKYLLDNSDANEDVHYGITDDKQGLWLDKEYVVNADWTDMYFNAFVKKYGSLTDYQVVLDKIKNILEQSKNENWDKSKCKEELKFINKKLLSKDYTLGFENIKQEIENPEVYELLKENELEEDMEIEKLRKRLQELQKFLNQPLCKQTFSMYNIINKYFVYFLKEKRYFLKRKNNPTPEDKNMKKIFETYFSNPLKKYVSIQEKKSNYMCIDCSRLISTKNQAMEITFLSDLSDDLGRKKSAFWNCKVDAYLCPICALVYSLAILGFTLVGETFVFINTNQNVTELLKSNCLSRKLDWDAKIKDKEKYPLWIARTINLLLQEKTREIGNVQVIIRELKDKNDKNKGYKYTFDIIPKEILMLFKDENIRKDLDKLSKSPYVKVVKDLNKKKKDFWNIHEAVILNILRYRNQYKMINQLLKMSIENEGTLLKATVIYDIQLRINLLRKKGKNGGELMNCYRIREEGYKLRNDLLKEKGSDEDSCIRGTIYQLLNALSVGNVEHFMEVIMRIYCSTKCQVPNAFIEFLKDRDTFVEYGYAFLLGLKGSH